MNLHSLTTTDGATHRRSRVGRGMGSGNGKTCGKGHKGQMARKGNKHKAGFEGGQMRLVRRVPKHGFHNFTRKTRLGVNVGDLERFDNGAEVTTDDLRAIGLVNGPADIIKILGGGELTKKLSVKATAFSETGKAKIEAAGGSCEVIAD